MLAEARATLRAFSRTLRAGPADPRQAPMPPAEGPLGHARVLRDDILRAFPQWAAEYGDAVSLRLPGIPCLGVFSAEAVRHVLQTNARNYSKRTRATEKMSFFLGKGLVTSDGDLWKRQRRIAAPAFHKQRIEGFAGSMVRATADMLDGWAGARGAVDVDRAMMALTMRIASETLLGRDLSGEADAVGEALAFLTINTNRRITRILDLPLAVPTPENVRYRRAVKVLDDLLVGLIAARRQSPGQAHDLLGMLLDARDEETGEGMTDTQLRDEAVTIFAAGHETTSNALSWTFLLLARHPDVAARLHQEVDAVLGGRAPTVADLAALPFGKSVLQESMRLFPPAWITDRRAEGDDEICGYHVPAGTRILISPWATHRHPRYWQDPEVFDPDRFTPARSEGRPAFAYFPFGGGPRVCIGNAFAMMEAQLILALVAQRFHLELAPGAVVTPERGITLRPAPTLPMVPRARAPRQTQPHPAAVTAGAATDPVAL
jgi:cytochrome P450